MIPFLFGFWITRTVFKRMTLKRLFYVAAIIGAIYLFGCATQPPPPPPVIVQAPVPPPKPPMPTDPYLMLDSDVTQAIKHHETPNLVHGIVHIFPYSPTDVYELNCQPLYATQIRLAPDEWTDKDNVMLGDDKAWSVTVGDGVVLVKPLRTPQTLNSGGPQPEIIPGALNMVTNMSIHTTKHDYTFNLRIKKPLTEAASFYYPAEVRAAYDTYEAARKHPEDYR